MDVNNDPSYIPKNLNSTQKQRQAISDIEQTEIITINNNPSSNEVEQIKFIPIDNKRRKIAIKAKPYVAGLFKSQSVTNVHAVKDTKQLPYRPSPSVMHASTPTSSGNNTPTNIDMDETYSQPQNNVVFTASQAFQKYDTYAPMDQQMCSYSNPPDNPPSHSITTNVRINDLQNLQKTCEKILNNSGDNQILITLHNNCKLVLPKSHLHIQTNPTIIETNLLNTLPSNPNYTYELLLLGDSYESHKMKILSFIQWTQLHNTKVLITIPHKYTQNFESIMTDYHMISINRPFQKDYFTSLNT
jgi:hypothetical protein